jgi:alkyl hydroperoxide reductase subunit AhpC
VITEFKSHRVNTPRKAGGLGKMDIPMLADKNGDIAKKYGIYKVSRFKLIFGSFELMDVTSKSRVVKLR